MGAAWSVGTADDDAQYCAGSTGQNTMQVGGFTFEGIAKDFERHVRAHLPWYDLATDSVAVAAKHYITDGGLVYDIGCASGNVGRSLADVLKSRRARLIGIDCSGAMAARYDAPGALIVDDIRGYEFQPFDVAVSMLTLMFLPPCDQLSTLRKLMASVRHGGAVIVLERFAGCGGYPQTIMQRLTFAAKMAEGTPAAEVMEKEMALIGVQRPLNRSYFYHLCDKPVEFFRYGEFSGYILQK